VSAVPAIAQVKTTTISVSFLHFIVPILARTSEPTAPSGIFPGVLFSRLSE
jgi:hypothetical protein